MARACPLSDLAEVHNTHVALPSLSPTVANTIRDRQLDPLAASRPWTNHMSAK